MVTCVPRLNHLLHPIETVRAAPLGSAFSAANLAVMAYFELPEHVPPYQKIGAGVITALGVAIGGGLAAKQLDLMDSLEDSMKRVGYNERILAPTTDYWCDRQTARIVCDRHAVLEPYEALVEANRDATLTWLPHV